MTETNTYESTGKDAVKSSSHVAYQVRHRDGKPDFWNRIGLAYPHRDGQGFNLQLDAMPLKGQIVLRIVKEN